MLIRFFNSTFAIEEPFNSQVWKSIAGVPWQDILMIISAITMTVGNLIAIQQNNIKRMLAYSSIAHAGYILMAVPVLSQEGIYAIIFYLIVYLFMQWFLTNMVRRILMNTVESDGNHHILDFL